MLPDELGQTIRRVREATGMSRALLAELSGVSTAALFRLEEGRASTRIDTVARVLHALNLRLVLDGPPLALVRAQEPTSLDS